MAKVHPDQRNCCIYFQQVQCIYFGLVKEKSLEKSFFVSGYLDNLTVLDWILHT